MEINKSYNNLPWQTGEQIVQNSLSFIIPTVGARENIFTIIDQLKRGIKGSFEIIVVLQPSKGNREDIVKMFVGLPGIRLETNKGKLSSGANRNRGAEKATGKFICFIDDDITLEESFITFLNEGILDENTVYFPEIRNERHVPFPLGDHVGGRSYVSACFVVSKGAFLQTGHFNEELNIYREDSEFFIRARMNGLELKFVEDVFVQHPVRFTNGKTIRSFFTKNTYEPLFHKITGGEYHGVMKSHFTSTLPGRQGFSIVTYFISLAVSIMVLLLIIGLAQVIPFLMVSYLILATVPTFVYIHKPEIFLDHGKLYKIPLIAIYLLIMPELFVARLIGSIRYGHFAI